MKTQTITLKQFLEAMILSLILSLILFLFHAHTPSQLNAFSTDPLSRDIYTLSNWGVEGTHYRYTHFSEFARRPVTSFLIKAVSNVMSVKMITAFILVEYGFIFFDFILLWYISRCFTIRHRFALASIILWYLSMPIFFSFNVGMYMYDEPLQYFFLYTAIIMLIHKKYVMFGLSIVLGLFSKDSTVLLFPGIYIYSFGFNEAEYKKHVLISLIGSLIVYTVLLYAWLSSTELLQETVVYTRTMRLTHFQYNFQNIDHTVETILLLITTLNFPIILLTILTKYTNKNIFKYGSFAFYLSICITVPVILFFARAQESRNFALPLSLIWPFMGEGLSKAYTILIALVKRYNRSNIFSASIIILISGMVYMVCTILQKYYNPTWAIGMENIYKSYVKVNISVISVFIVLFFLHRITFSKVK